MKKLLLAPLILATFGAATAFAGGRPVMYVVVDRVETTQDQSSISMIRIWGSFTRAKNPTLQLAEFSTPIDGYVQFGRGSDKEAPKWQKAAGTGKAVLVGSCAGAGALRRWRFTRPTRSQKTSEKTFCIRQATSSFSATCSPAGATTICPKSKPC
ncbi:hypothetical protein VT84_26710 [Gemmata sp. SH-PL17]|nr:hypothetical protein VT84_26710 [Gemmata sp. SH-PL17]